MFNLIYVNVFNSSQHLGFLKLCCHVNPHLCPGILWGWNSDGLTRQGHRCALYGAEHLRPMLDGGENWKHKTKIQFMENTFPFYGKLIKE